MWFQNMHIEKAIKNPLKSAAQCAFVADPTGILSNRRQLPLAEVLPTITIPTGNAHLTEVRTISWSDASIFAYQK